MYYPYDPISIVEATVDRLKTVSGLKAVVSGRTMPSTDLPLPFATVFHSGESATPMGDANCAEPHFDHKLSLDIGIMCNGASASVVYDNTNELIEQVKDALFRSTDWMQMFEGIDGYSVVYNYPDKEEEYTIELVMRIELMFRSIWEPILAHDFLEAVVETKLSKAKYSQPYITKIEIGDYDR